MSTRKDTAPPITADDLDRFPGIENPSVAIVRYVQTRYRPKDARDLKELSEITQLALDELSRQISHHLTELSIYLDPEGIQRRKNAKGNSIL